METARAVAPCYVATLSPSATSSVTALNWRPFGGQTLREIFATAAENAREAAEPIGSLAFDYYEMSEVFFFGQVLTGDAAERLRHVPSAIVDCAIFETESSAITDARNALLAFASTPGKILYRICRHGRCPHGIPAGLAVNTDLKLTFVLEAHLWNRDFAEMMGHHAIGRR
jgi:hypothetical protein